MTEDYIFVGAAVEVGGTARLLHLIVQDSKILGETGSYIITAYYEAKLELNGSTLQSSSANQVPLHLYGNVDVTITDSDLLTNSDSDAIKVDGLIGGSVMIDSSSTIENGILISNQSIFEDETFTLNVGDKSHTYTKDNYNDTSRPTELGGILITYS